MGCQAGPDLCFTRGDTAPIILTFKQNGTAIDFTSFSNFLLSVTSDEAPTDALTLIMAMDGTSPTPTSGEIEFRVADQGESDALTPGEYFYDVQWDNAASEKFTSIAGNFEIKQDRGKA